MMPRKQHCAGDQDADARDEIEQRATQCSEPRAADHKAQAKERKNDRRDKDGVKPKGRLHDDHRGKEEDNEGGEIDLGITRFVRP
jgi:hypothetical protein